MKRILSLLFVSAMLLALVPAYGATFSDVDKSLWCYNEITTLTEEKVISGYADGTFRPSESVTYGAALKLVLLAAGSGVKTPTTSGSPFSGYYVYARSKGYADEVKNLSAPATRLFVARLVARTLRVPRSEASSPYFDANDGYATGLYYTGIMQGSNDSSGHRLLKPSKSITRGEMAAVVWRIGHAKWRGTYAKNTGYILCSGKTYAINRSLPVSRIDTEQIGTKDGFLSYPGASLGVDVSSHQGKIDWNKVAGAGVKFAIVRVGYRGYGAEGTMNEDTRYLENIEGAKAAGLTVGVYFFSQAITTEEAREEADFILERIAGLGIDGPVVFDWERVSSANGRAKNLGKSALTACAAAFTQAVRNAGYEPYIYFDQTVGYSGIDLTQFGDCGWWLAEYNNSPNFYYNYQMWQYTDSGRVPGISGKTDLDLWF